MNADQISIEPNRRNHLSQQYDKEDSALIDALQHFYEFDLFVQQQVLLHLLQIIRRSDQIEPFLIENEIHEFLFGLLEASPLPNIRVQSLNAIKSWSERDPTPFLDLQSYLFSSIFENSEFNISADMHLQVQLFTILYQYEPKIDPETVFSQSTALFLSSKDENIRIEIIQLLKYLAHSFNPDFQPLFLLFAPSADQFLFSHLCDLFSTYCNTHERILSFLEVCPQSVLFKIVPQTDCASLSSFLVFISILCPYFPSLDWIEYLNQLYRQFPFIVEAPFLEIINHLLQSNLCLRNQEFFQLVSPILMEIAEGATIESKQAAIQILCNFVINVPCIPDLIDPFSFIEHVSPLIGSDITPILLDAINVLGQKYLIVDILIEFECISQLEELASDTSNQFQSIAELFLNENKLN